ncbi:MAG: ATP-binding protein [Rhodococcus sp. (in: high G+C Gram-positive bacteria)]
MSALDMDRLPTGLHHWRTLVEELLAVGDDRLEGHHLELKSEVDMSTKTGRAKIAKFILATANRSADLAAPRFSGHAVMLVGLDFSSTPPAIGGAGTFDDKDLRREVTNFVGDPGPAWDYQRIDIDGSEVVAIIVDPPKQAAIWPCQRDGEHVRNGVIYVRPGAESRPANGPEVTAMLNRVRHAQPAVEVDVQIQGSVWAVSFDPSAAVAQIHDAAGDVRSSCPRPPTSPATSGTGIGFASVALSSLAMPGFADRNDSRSRNEFQAEVDNYEAASIAAVEDVCDAVVAMSPGFSVRVANKTKRSHEDVEVVIHLDPPFDVVDHDDEIAADLLPMQPRKWGPEPLVIPRMLEPFYPSPAHTAIAGCRRVEQRADGGIDLMLDFGHLRPMRTVEIDDLQFVLIVPAEGAQTVMRARWSMTARDVHDQFTGDVAPVPVNGRDVSDAVARHVAMELRNSRSH